MHVIGIQSNLTDTFSKSALSFLENHLHIIFFYIYPGCKALSMQPEVMYTEISCYFDLWPSFEFLQVASKSDSSSARALEPAETWTGILTDGEIMSATRTHTHHYHICQWPRLEFTLSGCPLHPSHKKLAWSLPRTTTYPTIHVEK